MIGSIISAVIAGLLNWVNSWMKAKELEEAKFAARSFEAQKESMVEGKALEVQIQKAVSGISEPQTATQLKELLG